MFEQNNVGVRVENPIVSYIKRLGYDSEEWSSLYDEIEKICTDEEGKHFLLLIGLKIYRGTDV